MKFRIALGAIALTAGAALAAGSAQAKDLKIGLVLSMSGPFADYGRQIQNGIHLYMAEHGDTVAGRKIQLIVKDDTGIAPAIAKRQAQELLTKDKVDILAGFDLTPNAFSVAPLATEAKVPMVVMNAATSSITEKSPYITRVSMTLPQSSWAIAQWAYKNGIHSAYVMVADYGPGHDAQEQFKKTFTGLGGKILGEVRTPVNTADYSPFLQRVKDAKPDALFFFVPPGSSMVALAKNFRELGLDKLGIKEMGPGDMTDENSLPALGDAALGMITAFHYSAAHDSPENKAFVAAYAKAYPGDHPNFMSVGGYDGMQLIYKALEKTGGDAGGDAFMAAVKGMKWESPRGPVEIDAQTRDIVQNEYIRKLERVNGELQNVEFDTFKAVKDPGKQG
ncbi:MAG TPA: ABC transporter substrate-binding protein [Castellaniella sp.]|nr:ABC transporter substrate-binding protein [Castellaniella sp.]